MYCRQSGLGTGAHGAAHVMMRRNKHGACSEVVECGITRKMISMEVGSSILEKSAAAKKIRGNPRRKYILTTHIVSLLAFTDNLTQ
jgi:hypothetical protein